MPRKKIWSGFPLYQPWAVAVVEGRFPVLVRATKTNKRGRVLIIANEGIDGQFLFNLDNDQLKRAEDYFVFSCILGTIELIDCIPCKIKNIISQINKRAGKKAAAFYPIHMLPVKEPTEKVFLWMLRNPIKLKTPIPIKNKGFGWCRCELTENQVRRIKIPEKEPIPSFWDKNRR